MLAENLRGIRMQQLANNRKRAPTAFSIYLRTGRRVAGGAVEVKFNPWHDPANGRFTFAQRGAYYPGGGQDGAGQSRSKRDGIGSETQKPPRGPHVGGGSFGVGGATGSWGELRSQAPSGFRGGRGGSGGGGGATGSWDAPQDRRGSSGVRGGGGSFRGAGASGSWAPAKNGKGGAGFQAGNGSFGGGGTTGSWEKLKPKVTRAPTRHPGAALFRSQDSDHSGIDRKPPSAAAKVSHAKPEGITKNGYIYGFDSSHRTNRVTGTLVLEPAGRSKQNQANAGKPDRLPKDHGGHYIAQRFNGPTDAFNHFAQNGNFNKSGYARLEYKWEMSIKKGYKVSVDIRPAYEGVSRRPYKINVIYEIDGKKREKEFYNQEGSGND